MLQSIKDTWTKFEAWVHSWFPGFKTRATTALGAVGSAAAVGQQYITGLPATKYITTETLMIVSAIMFSLSFWFSNMGNRVAAKEAAL